MKAIFWILFTASLILLLAAIGYAWSNQSAHTGGNPFAFSLLFLPVLAIGVAGLLFCRGKWLPARLTVAVGVAGLTFGTFVTRLGILNSYGDWITSGMPDRNPAASLWLIAFTVCGIGGSIVVACLLRPGRKKPANA